ncbi:serine protease [Streptomyces sp. NPDC050610]|uniref:serine protease n=1 Tax=Streptomyces sp. NPDC050610 TaxID=3157097 RepID=UPI003447CF00
MAWRRTDPDEALVRIRDLAGRPRGTGFLADDHGTLITSHEAVDGLARVVLHASGEQTCLVGDDAVVALPESDLALVRTEGLSVPPLAVAASTAIEPGAGVRLRTRRWLDARVVGGTAVTYTATDRFHLLGAALELTVGDREGVRLGERAAGGPVLDARTGAVVAVLGTALHTGRRAGGFAIPLRATAEADPGGPLAALLARNAASVPAYGPDLNLAGALQLTALSLGTAGGPCPWGEPAERPDTAEEFTGFLGGDAPVLGFVGDPGTGRTTELAALAARRARGAAPAPTVWLRGADLRAGDVSVRDAVARALTAAGRIVTASAGAVGTVGDTAAVTPEGVARLTRAAGRPLLVLLDGPEEMPPALTRELSGWTAATAEWLRASGTRLIVACRPEHWEQAGALFPPGALHRPAPAARSASRALPPCARLAGLTPRQRDQAHVRYGLPADAAAPADAGHPLTLRLLAEVRAAMSDIPGEGGEGVERGGAGLAPGQGADAVGALSGREPGAVAESCAPDRWEVFSAYLDLLCLRVAVRLAAGGQPPGRGPAVRRLAARVAGLAHEAARRCLGPGQGELDRDSFEELFPWRTGWAAAVLKEGLLVPAGPGYRFAHEEFADWLQGRHLDLDTALNALVHRWRETRACQGQGDVLGSAPEAAVRLPSRPGTATAHMAEAAPAPVRRWGRRAARRWPAPAPPPEQPRPLPVPRHRIGPVLHALLLLGRRSGSAELADRLTELVHAVDALGAAGAERVGAERSGTEQVEAERSGTEQAGDERSGAGASEGSAPRGARRAAVEWGPAPPTDGTTAEPAGGDAWTVTTDGRLRRARSGAGGHAWVASAGGGARRETAADGRSAGRLPAADGGAPWGCDGPPSGDDRTPSGGSRSPSRDGRPSVPADEPPEQLSDQQPPEAERISNASWWAAHLLGETLLRVPDAVPYLGVLRLLADRVAARSLRHGGLGEFGPWFWLRLSLALPDRLELLRLLLPADAPPANAKDPAGAPERFLPAVAAVLAEDPCAAQALLCRWFTDDRPLRAAAAPDGDDLRPTVALAAQALLHTHRRRAVDDLTEALVDAAHPLADELLAALAEDEPSAVCRAVDRWAHDPRGERHAAAAAYGLRAAPHIATGADRELLRYAALALLARPAGHSLYGAALALLVRDPETRAGHLERALARFAAGDPQLSPSALAAALPTHPESVLQALRARLRASGDAPDSTLETMRTLADVSPPALARRAAELVREHVEHRPGGARHAAAFVDRRLEHGAPARALLFPLVCDMLRARSPHARRALAPVLAAPGTRLSRPLRHELLEVLLEHEGHGQYGQYGLYVPDAATLDALLRTAAEGAADRGPARTRDLVHRTGLLLARTAEGAACFDRRLLQLACDVPGFAALVRGWLESAPAEWAAVVGPRARVQLAGATPDAWREDPAWHS